MATHSSVLAWRIPWTEEPGGLQSLGSQRVRHDWASKHPQHRPQELAFIPLPHSGTSGTPPWAVCELQQGWISVARERHQAPREPMAGDSLLTTLCPLGQKAGPSEGVFMFVTLYLLCCSALLKPIFERAFSGKSHSAYPWSWLWECVCGGVITGTFFPPLVFILNSS